MAKSNQTDIQLRITAAIDGLVEISKLITEVDKLGGQTDESSVEVEKLVSELDQLRQQDSLINQFRSLKTSTAELSNVLGDARTRATELGKGVADSKSQLASTNAEYKNSKSVTEQLSNEWLQAKAKVELLTKAIQESNAPTREQRTELKAAKDEAKDLGKQYNASSKETAALDKALSKTESSLKQQTKEFNAARTTVNKLADQYLKQSGTLNTLRVSLQESGVNAKYLSSEQKNLKSTTAQVEKEVSDLATRLREQAQMYKYVSENADLSGRELLQYSAAAKQAKTNTSELNNHVTAGSSGFVSFARNVMATAAAFFTLNKAKDVLVDVVKTGSEIDVLSKTAARVGLSFEQINQVASETPMQLQEVMDAAIQAKNFGLDPMTGSLQAAIDAAYAQGKGAEEVQRIILALGQAYSKEKLQQEEVLQLVEAGVPAWQLLADATGKSVPELQKLSSAGALGRKEIELLIDAMGSKYAGAAQQVMDSTAGLASNLGDEFTRAKDAVANSGLMDYVNEQLKEAIAYLKQIREDGTLAEWGKSITSTLKAIGDYSSVAVSAIQNLSSEIKVMAQVWAGLKIYNWVASLKSLSTGFSKITIESSKSAVATNIAAKSFGALTPAIRLAAGALGLLKASFIGLAVSLGIEAIFKVIDAYREWRDAQDELEKSQQKQAKSAADVKQRLAEVSRQTGTTITSMEQFDKLLRENKIHFDEATKSYKAGPEPIKKIGEAAEETKPKLVEFYGIIQQLKGKIEELKPSDDPAKVITEMFDEVDIKSRQAVSNVIRNLGDLEEKGTITGKNISDGLGGYLRKLSDEELIKLQSTLSGFGGYMDSVGEKAREFSNKIDQELMGRLGINLQEIRNGWTELGKATINTFSTIVESGRFSSNEIKAAFDKSVDSSKTETEVNSLIQILKDAGKKGKVSASDIASGMDQATKKIKELKGIVDKTTVPIDALGTAFNTLGVTSSSALKKMADETKKAFNQISSSGNSTLQDQQSAFMKYAEASLKASAATGELPDPMLQAEARAIGMGAAFDKLKSSLDDTKTATGEVKEAFTRVGQSNPKEVTDNATDLSKAVKSYSVAVPMFKAATVDAAKASEYMGMSVKDLTTEIQKQQGEITHLSSIAAIAAPDSFGIWTNSINKTTVETKRFYNSLARAAIEVKNLEDDLSSNPSESLIKSAERALTAHKKLGEENLSGLKSAIDAAKQKMDSLNSSAKSTLDSLKDQWDQLNGNEISQENRRYANETADLEDQLAEARSASNQKAIRDLQQSLELSKKIHSQKMETIQAEQDAAKADSQQATTQAAATTATQPTATKVIELKLGSTTATIQTDAAGEAALEQMLSQLESASQISMY